MYVFDVTCQTQTRRPDQPEFFTSGKKITKVFVPNRPAAPCPPEIVVTAAATHHRKGPTATARGWACLQASSASPLPALNEVAALAREPSASWATTAVLSAVLVCCVTSHRHWLPHPSLPHPCTHRAAPPLPTTRNCDAVGDESQPPQFPTQSLQHEWNPEDVQAPPDGQGVALVRAGDH